MSEVLLYITAPSVEDAETIGRKLVEERLAACANILPGMRSVYQWQGKIETAEEVVLLVKTTGELAKEVTGRIVDLHSYEVPCVVELEIKGGHAPFLAWIHEETRG